MIEKPLANPINCPEGLTIQQFKKIVKDWPEFNSNGDPYEIWVDNGNGLTNVIKHASRLNENDIYLSTTVEEEEEEICPSQSRAVGLSTTEFLNRIKEGIIPFPLNDKMQWENKILKNVPEEVYSATLTNVFLALSNSVFLETQRYRPTSLLVSSEVLEIVKRIPGFAKIPDMKGIPFFEGTLGSFVVYSFPDWGKIGNPNRFLLFYEVGGVTMYLQDNSPLIVSTTVSGRVIPVKKK